MEIVKHELMVVCCEHCETTCQTDNLDDFRDVGNTYPPTIMFMCPECKSESVVHGVPKRLLQHMVMKISKECGYDSGWHFARGSKVYV